MAMTNEELQTKIAVHDAKFDAVLAKIDATNQRIDDFIGEIRDRDNKRAEENKELRDTLKDLYKATDEKIASINNQVQNISFAAFAGIGATVLTAVIGIAAMVWSAISK